MREFLILFKLHLKTRFRSKEKNEKQKIATPIIVSLSMLPIVAMICFAIYMLTLSAVRAGIVTEVLVLIMSSAQLFTLFFVSKVYITTFYNAEDNEFLATLPAKPLSLFFAKLSTVYLSELLFSAFLLLPTLISATVAMVMAGYNVPVLFYFSIPLAVLFAPVIPLFIIAMLSAPIMYIASFFKRRGAMSSIMSILLFLVIMGGYFALVPNFSRITELQNDLPMQAIAVFKKLGNVLYFNKTFFNAALNINFAVNFFVTLGIILGAFAVTGLLVSFTYTRSISAQFETKTKSKAADFNYKSTSTVRALMANDFRALIRTPGLAFNSLLNIFMAPLILVAMGLFTSGDMFGGAESGADPVLSSQLIQLSFVFMYAMMLNVGMNYAATLAFTREGRSFYFLKHLPIGFHDIMKSKRYFADIVSASGIVLIMIVSMILYKFNVLVVLGLGLTLVIFASGFNMFGITRDMKKPNFEWTTIEEATKRNLYIMLPFLFAIIIGMVGMGGGAALTALLPYIHENWLFVIFFGVFIVVGIILWFVFRNSLLSKQETLFANMGEPVNFVKVKTQVLKSPLKF